MNGTMAQNSEPRRSTCAAGVNDVLLRVKFGRLDTPAAQPVVFANDAMREGVALRLR